MEVKSRYRQTSIGTIPEDWDAKPAERLCLKIQDGTHFSPKLGGDDYLYITSKNIGRGMLNLANVDRISAAEHRKIYTRCDTRKGDLLLTKDGVNTGNAAINTLDEEVSILSSVAFLRFIPGLHEPMFYMQYLLSDSGQARIKELMSGNAITRLTLQKIKKFMLPVPPLPEQRAIAAALSDTDDLIAGLERLIAKKRAVKQAAMQQLLTGKTRLPGFAGEWEKKKLGSILDYEQPWKFISRNTELDETGHVPVLTANKTFILGYTDESDGIYEAIPTIIFDDFTTSSKYVDFPFKVRSSALKILRAKNDLVNLRFVFEKMQLLDFSVGDHKRHYISQYQELEIDIPSLEEQQGIGSAISDMDAEIAALERRRDKMRALKQGMMQELLTGRTRLV